MSHKRRFYNKFNSAAGCPYGNDFRFLHDEISNDRESVVISLGLGGNSGGGGEYAKTVTTGYTISSSHSNNHKTKLYQKFETMDFFPYGGKCLFAHGSNELVPNYGGFVVPVPEVGMVVPTAPVNHRPVEIPVMPSTQNPTVGYAPIVPQLGGYPIGVTPEKLSLPPYPRLKPRHLRKDRNLVRQTYADWIDEME